jgi:hypothetical protein
MIGMKSPKTLRKHFATELEEGHAETMRTLTSVAYEMAVSGRYPAMTMFWLKVMEQWSEENPAPEPMEFAPPPPRPATEMIFLSREPEEGNAEFLGEYKGYYIYRSRSGTGKYQSAAASFRQVKEGLRAEETI